MVILIEPIIIVGKNGKYSYLSGFKERSEASGAVPVSNKDNFSRWMAGTSLLATAVIAGLTLAKKGVFNKKSDVKAALNIKDEVLKLKQKIREDFLIEKALSIKKMFQHYDKSQIKTLLNSNIDIDLAKNKSNSDVIKGLLKIYTQEVNQGIADTLNNKEFKLLRKLRSKLHKEYMSAIKEFEQSGVFPADINSLKKYGDVVSELIYEEANNTGRFVRKYGLQPTFAHSLVLGHHNAEARDFVKALRNNIPKVGTVEKDLILAKEPIENHLTLKYSLPEKISERISKIQSFRYALESYDEAKKLGEKEKALITQINKSLVNKFRNSPEVQRYKALNAQLKEMTK